MTEEDKWKLIANPAIQDHRARERGHPLFPSRAGLKTLDSWTYGFQVQTKLTDRLAQSALSRCLAIGS